MNEPDDSSDGLAEAVPSKHRRNLLLAAAGVAAASGATLAWWHGHGAMNSANLDPLEALWTLKWETPAGRQLQMLSFKGRPLLLNFWATWCPPCVEELPLLNSFFGKNKENGWQVLGLAVDKLAPVQAFLQKMPVEFPVAMAGLAGADLGRKLGNMTGGLPFTVVLGKDGLVAHRKMGRISVEDLVLWASIK
ncbi:TlpA family protein disulfide reductase [Rhodoferax aquaticus]|uniref:TlpA family protein disulfide reductase n=2 Tax=Rhodoferax aquaticus TaxID=2527691 RepID=A0A515ELV3_9BURK|nr:TlpA family protein disulfide reductase [Rhodoferax aquaticus]